MWWILIGLWILAAVWLGLFIADCMEEGKGVDEDE